MYEYVIVLEEHKNKTLKSTSGHKYSACRIGRQKYCQIERL